MSNYKKRSEVPSKYKWDLTKIFSNINDWERTYKKIEDNIEKLKFFKGKLGEESEVLFKFLKLETETSELYERLAVYARMKEDENTKDSERQSLVQRISPLGLKYSSAVSFFSNQILNIPDEKWDDLYKNKELLFYKKSLDEILRGKKHILSPEKEEVLSQTSLLYSAGDTFRMLDNADLTFDDIIDKEGEKLPLNNSNYSVYLTSKERDIRKQAFENLYKSYENVKNTLASTMLGNLKKDKFHSQIRHYESSLDKSLFSDNISKDVYLNLISSVHDNLEHLHRYVRVRKDILNLNELHTYDMYVGLFDVKDEKIPYEEAYDMMIEALGVLGDDYIDLLKKARDNGWIDVYPTDGKRNGAYSWGPYSQPYVLLNHKDDLDSLFTLAHEMGHCLHSSLSDSNLPYDYAQYCIFVAEVASTVNEVLLMKHLLNKTTDKNERKYLISEFLDKFKSTLFRQTQFAEFEMITHSMVENDEPLTGDDMNRIYGDLNKKYYGEHLAQEKQIELEWSRIPHFYNSFYVYQYATGFSAAIAIANRISEEGQTAVNDYKNFLKSGGSDYPVELLKIAGVDMSSPEPINNAIKLFKELLNELESLI